MYDCRVRLKFKVYILPYTRTIHVIILFYSDREEENIQKNKGGRFVNLFKKISSLRIRINVQTQQEGREERRGEERRGRIK